MDWWFQLHNKQRK